jgi:hypothetical protein
MRALNALPVVLALALAACEKPSHIEMTPASLHFGMRGQSAKIHAEPIARSGQKLANKVCKWSSSNEAVATVSGPHNVGTVTAVGPGTATVTCRAGGHDGTAAVQVRLVARVAVKPERAELRMTDEAAPFALQVTAFDDVGAPVQGRAATARCADENVCRGDGRAQLWAVGAGETTAVVEVEGARSAVIPVRVVDARTADGRPRAVRGNPMEAIERAVRERDEAERKARGE